MCRVVTSELHSSADLLAAPEQRSLRSKWPHCGQTVDIFCRPKSSWTKSCGRWWRVVRYAILLHQIVDSDILWFVNIISIAKLFQIGSSDVLTHIEWLKENLPPNSRVGIDSFLISASDYRQLSTQLQASGHTAVPMSINIVDLIWKNRPPLRLSAIEPLEFRFSGRDSSFIWFVSILSLRYYVYSHKKNSVSGPNTQCVDEHIFAKLDFVSREHHIYTYLLYWHSRFIRLCLGKRAFEKVADVREKLRDMGAETHIITALDSIACEWVLTVCLFVFFYFLYSSLLLGVTDRHFLKDHSNLIACHYGTNYCLISTYYIHICNMLVLTPRVEVVSAPLLCI